MPNSQAKAQNNLESNNDDLWAVRGDYWIKNINPVIQYKPRTRRRINKPLVLSGHGIKLNIDSGTLVINCGFTHYPQEREHYRFFSQDRRLPSRVVILDGDGSITLNALKWLSEQEVPLVQINWRGEIVSTSAANYAADPEIVFKQYSLRELGRGFEFATQLIYQKLLNSVDTISQISNSDPNAESAIKILTERAESIRVSPPKDIQELLNVEAIAAAAYFRYWFHLPIKWRGLNRKPIPEEWMHIGTRRGMFKSNQSASHPINAILNYAYGALEHQVQSHILAFGADPTIGCLHKNLKSPQSLVFDLMEPLRPIMDKQIVAFLLSRTFAPEDFILERNGVCKLHPQFARYVVKSIQDIPEIEKITKANLRNLIRAV